MAETEAPQYKGSVGDSKQHISTGHLLFPMPVKSLWAKEENRISEQEGEKIKHFPPPLSQPSFLRATATCIQQEINIFGRPCCLFNPFETQPSGIPSFFQAQNLWGSSVLAHSLSLDGASPSPGRVPHSTALESAWPRRQEVPELVPGAGTSPCLAEWVGRGWG